MTDHVRFPSCVAESQTKCLQIKARQCTVIYRYQRSYVIHKSLPLGVILVAKVFCSYHYVTVLHVNTAFN
jgi:hypothetical protein